MLRNGASRSTRIAAPYHVRSLPIPPLQATSTATRRTPDGSIAAVDPTGCDVRLKRDPKETGRRGNSAEAAPAGYAGTAMASLLRVASRIDASGESRQP